MSGKKTKRQSEAGSVSRLLAGILGAVVCSIGGTFTTLGVQAGVRLADFVVAVLSVLTIVGVTWRVHRLMRRRIAGRADRLACVVAILPLVVWLDVIARPADGWPREWTNVIAFVSILLLALWLWGSWDGPRPALNDMAHPLAEGAASAALVLLLAVMAPVSFAATGIDASADHAVSQARTTGTNGGNRETANPGTGTGGIDAGGAASSGGSGLSGGSGNGGADANPGGIVSGNTGSSRAARPQDPCGLHGSAPGSDSANPDLSSAFYNAIVANNGPGLWISGCLGPVQHLGMGTSVEYAYGYDNANDRESVTIVSPSTRAFFLRPAVDAAVRLMSRFGVITTSGVQCAGNGGWILIYDSQGTVALVRGTLDRRFQELPPPVFYGWLASMQSGEAWSWPVAAGTHAGITKFRLLHDLITRDVVDTVYYDAAAGRAWRVVDGQTTYYSNVPQERVSASTLKALAPLDSNCPSRGLTPNSDFPAPG